MHHRRLREVDQGPQGAARLFDKTGESGRLEGSLQAYEDLGIRAFQGLAMMDRPIIDNFPFVADYVTPDEHARLRALPRPTRSVP